jgi:hypothetical protein
MLQEQELQISSGNNILEESKNDLDNFQKIYVNYYNRVVMLSISDIMNDTESYRNSFEQMAGIINKIDSRYNYYYDIVDNYDFYERPDEIDELDGIVNKLENLKYDFEDLKNIFEEFLNGAKHLSNIQLPQKQNTINIG